MAQTGTKGGAFSIGLCHHPVLKGVASRHLAWPKQAISTGWWHKHFEKFQFLISHFSLPPPRPAPSPPLSRRPRRLRDAPVLVASSPSTPRHPRRRPGRRSPRFAVAVAFGSTSPRRRRRLDLARARSEPLPRPLSSLQSIVARTGAGAGADRSAHTRAHAHTHYMHTHTHNTHTLDTHTHTQFFCF